MGCGTSKPLVETPDDVLRNCKVRRSHISEAIKYRKDFAISHAAYIHSLKDVGSALRHFALGEFVDADVSPGLSHTPVLALPPPSTPSVGGLSPPRSSSHTSTLSPPQSGSRVNVNVNPPSSLPLSIPISPALSPIRLPIGNPLSFAQSPTIDRSPSPTESPPASLHGTSPPVHTTDMPLPPLHSFNNMVSPDRGSEFSAPYYSPSRDDLDDALVEYSPPPPSSLLADSSWFNFDIFTPPLIPQHLQEQRRMKRVVDTEQEDIHGVVKIEEVEVIPDLEEVEPKEDEAAHDDKDALLNETMLEEVEKRVVRDEMVDASQLKASEEESGVPDSLEENPSVAPIIPPEMVAPESAGNEMPNKEPAAAIILKVKNLSEAMQHIDDLFARAYQCGRDVSRMLETQMHHVNSMKDASKVFNAITSHWSRRTPSMMREDPEDNDLLECGMAGSHTSTLERLYAWERKLNLEVKEGKLLRIDFDQKFKQLHNLDAKGGDQAVRDKLKVSLKKLDTRLMVAIRAIRAASLRIQTLTNEELYPQLSEMLGGLVSMWSRIAECHRLQAAIASEMQTFEDTVSEIDATEAQKKATVKLRHELENLKTHFQGWIWSQKKYIVELDEWIKRCYDIKEPSKESTKSSKRGSLDSTEKAPIFQLLKAWRKLFGDLNSQQAVVDGIKSFANVVHFLEENQSNELKLKRQAEKSTRRLDQQTTFLNKLERQYSESNKYKPTSNFQGKRARLDKYKSQADMGKHDLLAAVQVRKDVTLDLLKQQLPMLFKSMSSFAEDAKKMYETVKEEAEAVDLPDKQKNAARLTWP